MSEISGETSKSDCGTSGMPRPFLLYLARFQSLEKFLPALEIAMESRRQQRLPETERTIQENILVLICNVIDITSFVNVQILS